MPTESKSVPERIVDLMYKMAGSHPGSRPVHAKGLVCQGTFRASAEAPRIALWPADRPTAELGRLEIGSISPTSAADEQRLIFDPANVADGIELSADPILLARSPAYGVSYARRNPKA